MNKKQGTHIEEYPISPLFALLAIHFLMVHSENNALRQHRFASGSCARVPAGELRTMVTIGFPCQLEVGRGITFEEGPCAIHPKGRAPCCVC